MILAHLEMTKAIGKVVAAIIIAAVSFAVGSFVGIELGHVNAHIDFCTDEGSGRYINSQQVRREVCD